MIRYHVDQEVEKALLAVEDDIKANVADLIRDLPRRIMSSIPPPAQISDESEQNFNTLGLLENFDFDFSPEEGFNFGEISSDYEPLAVSDSSLSSSWSDPAMPSSATSLQDEIPTSFCLGV
jgi:hypothetical protein